MRKQAYNTKQMQELVLQSLEVELGGVKVYETALTCAVNEDLANEWEEYLAQTRTHVDVATLLCEQLGIDPNEMTPSRAICRHLGASLVKAMQMAKEAGDAAAAELVACECVVLAETKDHADWELIGHVAKHGSGDEAKILLQAHDAVEQDEDHHIYHTKGWCRELWIQALGFPAVLPPPEEIRQVETAIGAARAEQSRDSMSKQ